MSIKSIIAALVLVFASTAAFASNSNDVEALHTVESIYKIYSGKDHNASIVFVAPKDNNVFTKNNGKSIPARISIVDRAHKTSLTFSTHLEVINDRSAEITDQETVNKFVQTPNSKLVVFVTVGKKTLAFDYSRVRDEDQSLVNTAMTFLI